MEVHRQRAARKSETAQRGGVGESIIPHDLIKRGHCERLVATLLLRRGLGATGIAALGLDLVPGLTQSFGKVVVHGACDGDRVVSRLWLFVDLAQAAAKVFLDHRVTHQVG